MFFASRQAASLPGTEKGKLFCTAASCDFAEVNDSITREFIALFSWSPTLPLVQKQFPFFKAESWDLLEGGVG